MLPLMMAAGAGLAGAGLIGAYASGAMNSTSHVQAPQTNKGSYVWGGDKNALPQETKRLTGFEDQSRALAQSARGDQAALATRYADMEAGRGPSLAREQLREGANTAANNASNLAASVRGGGGNQLLAMRDAQNAGVQASAAANESAAQVRAQEQLGAMQAQAALYQGMRAADQQAYQNDMAARYGLEGQQLDANMQEDKLRMGAEQWAAQTNVGIDEANKQRKAALWGGLTNAGASMATMGMAGGGGGGGGGGAPTEDEWEAAAKANGQPADYWRNA